jgi:GTP:adenosylcobinamide-phosphate guanylyltransferase
MPDSDRQKLYTAIILAGERGPGDPLVTHASACCKAMIEIDGTPMIIRVLAALESAAHIGRCILSGPGHEVMAVGSPISRLLESGSVDWCEPQSTPSTSAYSAMQRVAPDVPVLVTTADHPLLSAEIVDHFCAQTLARGVDVTVGLAPYGLVKTAFPDMKKTVLRFRDGDYCGCNLFAFLTAEGRRMADYWRRVETQRKNPVRIIRILGWGAVIRYLLGRLTLQSALESLSRRLHLNLGAVILPYAEAAVDIDSIADHDIVQKKLSQRANPRDDHGIHGTTRK